VELTHNSNLLWYVCIYGIVMVIIGIKNSKGVKTSDDFLLAGKGLSPIVVMGTLLATWCGSGAITGGANSIAYSYGIWPAIFFMVPSIAGILVMYLLASKIRKYSKYTIPEMLEMKYGSFAKTLSSIIIILSYIGIISYQFKGLGFVLNVTTGLPIDIGTIISTILIIFLTIIGGLKSVAITDAISAFIMLFALIITVPSVIKVGGGWNNVVANVPKENLSFSGSLSPLQVLGYYLPVFILLLSDQNMYQRIISSNTDKSAKIAIKGWFIGMLIITPCVAVSSFAARSLFPDIEPGMSLISTSLVTPTFVGGMLLAAATAFIITTGNSFLLSVSTNITFDIYAKYIKPNATDKEKLRFTKIMIPIIGIISFVMIRFFPNILSLQMYAYTVYGASLTPAVLAVFLWDKANKAGGIASMIVGIVTTILWEIPLGKPHDINSCIIAVPAAVIALIVFTLLTDKGNNKDELIA
jgi:SSS family solute:Na+ symporter